MKIVSEKIVELHNLLLKFFRTAKNQHLLCIKALKEKKISLFQKVEQQERQINIDHYRIFRKIVYHFTTFNAYGSELRDLLSFAFIINEIERIADYASNIAKFYEIESNILAEAEILVSSWQKLIDYFEEIESLLKKTDLIRIEDNLKNKEKFDMNEIFEKLERFWKPQSAPKFSRKNYYFFLQFKFLSRSHERLTNILEYLLFKKSFFKFRDFKKNK